MTFTHPCPDFEDIIPLIVTGAATRDEAQKWAAHEKTGCAGCLACYRDMLEVPFEWAKSSRALVPPAHIKRELLKAIEAETAIAPVVSLEAARQKRKSLTRETVAWALAASFLLMFGSMYATLKTVKTERYELLAQVEALNLDLAEKESLLATVRERQTQLVSLSGLTPSPQASGRVFWNAQTRTGYFVAFDLPELPADKVYQLWTISGQAGPAGAPVDAGVFSPENLKTGLMKIKSGTGEPSAVQVFAVTIEPVGGSPQPTGAMYLKGGI